MRILNPFKSAFHSSLVIMAMFSSARGDEPLTLKVDFGGLKSFQEKSVASYQKIAENAPSTKLGDPIAIWKLIREKGESVSPLSKGRIFISYNTTDNTSINFLLIEKVPDTAMVVEVFWPQATELKLGPRINDQKIQAPEGQRILVVDRQGNGVQGANITVSYDSSKRKESYSTDTRGIAFIEKSSLDKARAISVEFKNGLSVYMAEKSSWVKGLVVVEPWITNMREQESGQ